MGGEVLDAPGLFRRAFQYPLMDRLYFGGEVYDDLFFFVSFVSVSSDGSFVFWGAFAQHARVSTCEVSVSSDGSFVFWGALRWWCVAMQCDAFQYPLMDRLYFGGPWRATIPHSHAPVSVSSDGSFVFWGLLQLDNNRLTALVSVSSDGSFVFWGGRFPDSCTRSCDVSVSSDGSFVFWGVIRVGWKSIVLSEFQYPLMDRLYFGGLTVLPGERAGVCVSVSSDGSFVFWGATA